MNKNLEVSAVERLNKNLRFLKICTLKELMLSVNTSKEEGTTEIFCFTEEELQTLKKTEIGLALIEVSKKLSLLVKDIIEHPSATLLGYGKNVS